VAVAAAGLLAAGGGAAFATADGSSTAPAKKSGKTSVHHGKRSPARHHECHDSGAGLNTAQDL